MEIAFAWVQQNWFNAVQTIGIVGSILLTWMSLRRDTRARQVADYLTLTAQHRELWGEMHRRPELARVPQSDVDLVASPLSVPEEEFLLLVLNQFQAGWLMAQEGGLLSLDVLATDARAFFALPLPRLVWNKTKQTRDPRFVKFVEIAFAHNP